jgi:hypothetical protein
VGQPQSSSGRRPHDTEGISPCIGILIVKGGDYMRPLESTPCAAGAKPPPSAPLRPAPAGPSDSKAPEPAWWQVDPDYGLYRRYESVSLA